MNTSNKTRWSVKISKETDIAVRGFLAQRGLKKGDISKFVEEAVRWRVLDQTVEEARARFSDMPKEIAVSHRRSNAIASHSESAKGSQIPSIQNCLNHAAGPRYECLYKRFAC